MYGFNEFNKLDAADDIGPLVSKEIESRLPLSSVVCHTRGLKNTTRIIQSLDIELKRYQSDQFPRTGMSGFVQNVFFLHLFITSCIVVCLN